MAFLKVLKATKRRRTGTFDYPPYLSASYANAA